MSSQPQAIHPRLTTVAPHRAAALCPGRRAQSVALVGPLNVDDAVIYALQHNPQVLNGQQTCRSPSCKSMWRVPTPCLPPA